MQWKERDEKVMERYKCTKMERKKKLKKRKEIK